MTCKYDPLSGMKKKLKCLRIILNLKLTDILFHFFFVNKISFYSLALKLESVNICT